MIRAWIRRWGRGIVIVLILALALVWITPIWLAFVSSLKSWDAFKTTSAWVLPLDPNFTNYVNFWTRTNFWLKISNSLLSSFSALVISMVLSFSMAYAIAIGRHKWRRVVLVVCVIVFVLPQEAFAYPVYLLAKMFDVYGSIWALVVPLGIIGTAFGTFLLSEIMSHFPVEMLEAARIDGAGRWQVLRRIVLPVMMPSILTVALLLFVANWNEYLFTLLLLPREAAQTVPLAIASIYDGGRTGPDPTVQAAAAIIGALPSIVIFLIFQRSLVRGITMGSAK